MSWLNKYKLPKYQIIGTVPFAPMAAPQTSNVLAKKPVNTLMQQTEKDALAGFYNLYDQKINEINKSSTGTNNVSDVGIYSQFRYNPKTFSNDSFLNLTQGRYKGARVPKKIIDDIIDSAKRNNFPIGKLLALAGRESTFGSGFDEKSKERLLGGPQGIISGWNIGENYEPYEPVRFMADNKVPGIATEKDKHSYRFSINDEKAANAYLLSHPELLNQYQKKIASTPALNGKNYYDLAVEFLKNKGVKGYNPGDPNYENKVNQEYQILLQDQALQSYLKQKGVRFKDGGLNKYQSLGQVGDPSQPYHPITNPQGYRTNNPLAAAITIAKQREQEKAATSSGRAQIKQGRKYDAPADIEKRKSFARSYIGTNQNAAIDAQGYIIPKNADTDLQGNVIDPKANIQRRVLGALAGLSTPAIGAATIMGAGATGAAAEAAGTSVYNWGAANPTLQAIHTGMQAAPSWAPGLTGYNALNAGLFYKGTQELSDVSDAWKTFNEHPTLGNMGDVAVKAGVTTLDMLPFASQTFKGIPSVLQDINQIANWAGKNNPLNDFVVASALSKQLRFGKPRFNTGILSLPRKIDPIDRSSVNIKNDFTRETTPEEYNDLIRYIYSNHYGAYDRPLIEFKGTQPNSFLQGVGSMDNQKEGLLFKEKFCLPGSECAKSANAVTNRIYTDITGEPFDAIGNAHNAWHMEEQMTRNGAVNLQGRFPIKVGDRLLMGNGVDQSTYVPGFTADRRVRHAGVFAGMQQTEQGLIPMVFESGKNNPMFLNPMQHTFTGSNSVLEAVRPSQFIDDSFGQALVDKNIRYAFRNKPAVANYSSDNPAVQQLLTDAEPFRETIKRTYDITNDEFNELLNSLVSIGGQETKLKGALPGSKLAKAKIQLQDTLNRFGLLKPLKQGVNVVKKTLNAAALPSNKHLPAYPGSSRVEMEAAQHAAENNMSFEEALREIKSRYQPKPKYNLSTVEPSKGIFRQKYQTELDRLSNFGSDIKSKNSVENGLGQMSANYNLIKKTYPNATPRQLMDITTLMWNSPGKALNKELVDFYIFGKNNPDPARFNFDYINKVNAYKNRYINIKPQSVDNFLDLFRNGQYPEIQYSKGGSVSLGQEMTVTPQQLEELKRQGYKIQML